MLILGGCVALKPVVLLLQVDPPLAYKCKREITTDNVAEVWTCQPMTIVKVPPERQAER